MLLLVMVVAAMCGERLKPLYLVVVLPWTDHVLPQRGRLALSESHMEVAIQEVYLNYWQIKNEIIFSGR